MLPGHPATRYRRGPAFAMFPERRAVDGGSGLADQRAAVVRVAVEESR
jgi:hypothetical protein